MVVVYLAVAKEHWRNRLGKRLEGAGGSNALSLLGSSSETAAKNKQPPTSIYRRLSCFRQMVCKPGSVGLFSQPGRSFLYEHDHSCSLAAYPRCLDRGGHLSPHIWPCSSWGLPCRSCCHECGGLLLHRFTLAIPKNGGLFSVALSVTSGSRHPCPGVTWQPVHRSPDFPRTGKKIPMRDRPTICLVQYNQ